MKRRLYSLAVGFWLLLLVATLAVWARGYFAAEGLVINLDGRPAHAVSVRGGLYFALFTGYPDAVRTQWIAQPADDFSGMFLAGKPMGGFRFASHEYVGHQVFRALVVPHWFAAALAGVMFWIFRRLHRRAPRFTGKGQCSSCGYDIRATPQRCPECGTVPSVAS